MRKKIGFPEAKRLMEQIPAPYVVDVREEEEYVTGHAADAILLPVDDITAQTAAEALPDAQRPVLVYCRTGRRSAEAARKLEALGYPRVFDMGGLVGWPYGLE